MLGGRTNGGPTSLWACTGSSALKEPVVGLFQGVWGLVMRGGSLLKLSYLFPLLSLKGTSPTPRGLGGSPGWRFRGQHPGEWGEVVRGQSLVNSRPWRTCQGTKKCHCFSFFIPKPHHCFAASP